MEIKKTDPIKNFNPSPYPLGDLMQGFGENHDLYSKAVCFEGNCLQGHNGWDIVREWGTPIYACEGGVVVEAKEEITGYGKSVRIINFGTGNEWTYGHLSKIDYKLSTEIKEGNQLGIMGNTGFVVSGNTPYWKSNPYAGTHLHLGLRKVTPAGATWNTGYPSGDKAIVLNYNNGYFGSIDPAPYFPVTKHYFNKDIVYGEKSPEVTKLQIELAKLGYFKGDPTSYYGPITKQSVYNFQLAYVNLSWYEKYIMKGDKVGIKTRKVLNG